MFSSRQRFSGSQKLDFERFNCKQKMDHCSVSNGKSYGTNNHLDMTIYFINSNHFPQYAPRATLFQPLDHSQLRIKNASLNPVYLRLASARYYLDIFSLSKKKEQMHAYISLSSLVSCKKRVKYFNFRLAPPAI